MIVLIPLTFNYLEVIKIPYYALNNGLRPIEIMESDLNITHKGKIQINMRIRNYSKDLKKFDIKIILPESVSSIISEREISVANNIILGPKDESYWIEVDSEFCYKNDATYRELSDTHYRYDSYYIVLFNNENKLKIHQDYLGE